MHACAACARPKRVYSSSRYVPRAWDSCGVVLRTDAADDELAVRVQRERIRVNVI